MRRRVKRTAFSIQIFVANRALCTRCRLRDDLHVVHCAGDNLLLRLVDRANSPERRRHFAHAGEESVLVEMLLGEAKSRDERRIRLIRNVGNKLATVAMTARKIVTTARVSGS